MSNDVKLVSEVRCFRGVQRQYSHRSTSLQSDMHFSVYLPDANAGASSQKVLLWLSGLTCNDQNFVTKAGAQRVSSELGITVVCPDTSPRGLNVADDEAYDLGQGAGFYVDATQNPWQAHYQMYTYINQELTGLIQDNFAHGKKIAISGHSMGGHGALISAIKNPQSYSSVSAFAPIANPSESPWGQKAFSAYLGDDKQQWREYDATELLKSSVEDFEMPMLVDQGQDDNFLVEQKLTSPLEGLENILNAEIRYQHGFDHSYFFVSTFIEEHLRFHFKHL